MEVYDQYQENMNRLPEVVIRMEAKRQERILDRAFDKGKMSPESLTVLEIGMGTGDWARASHEKGWTYTGIDRNQKICDSLAALVTTHCTTFPPLPEDVPKQSFDLVYCAFVVEHLENGIQAHAFIQEMGNALKDDGIGIVVVPDAISLGLEFWNIDYTHSYPTTIRNISQIIGESHLDLIDCYRYRAAGYAGWRRKLIQLFGLPFNYRLMSSLTGHEKSWYSVYQYIKQDILVFTFRRSAASESASDK